MAGAGVALGAGLAVGGFFYASLWPGSRIFGRPLESPRRPGELALTFDDGPNAIWTPRLLGLLAEQGVKATFFMVGGRAQQAPDLVRRVHREGHAIGIHSWSHANLSRASSAQIEEELTRSRAALEEIVGQRIRLFRPPFGARRPAVFRIARRMGLEPVLWDAMTNDWAEPETEKIVARLRRKIDRRSARGRAVCIVLHDGGHLDPLINREPSVTAAGRLMAAYTPTHRFVTLEEWL